MSTLDTNMRELRLQGLWLLLGWSFVVGVIWATLAPSPPKLDVHLPHLDKLEHAFAYFLITGWFTQMYKRPRLNRYAWGFLLMGMGLEVLQGLGGVRLFEVADMLANASGVMLAWLLAPTRFGEVLERIERYLLPSVA